MKHNPKVIIAQTSISLSDIDNRILSKMRHDGTRWLYDEKPMDSVLQKELNQLICKMEKIVDDARHAMGFQS